MDKSLRILILEDNPADAELVQFELHEAGLIFTAKVVRTEKDFVRELQNFSPDLILSDYDLPQYNGALALAEARKIYPHIPFILVTGAVGEDRAIEILTQGAKDYVLKSRLHQRLASAVIRALEEAKEQRARAEAEEELRKAHRTLEAEVEERTAELQKEIEHRRRIEASLLKYNERLEILSYTAGQLLASNEPQQLVEDLCRKVMKFLDCDVFFNFIVNDSLKKLQLNAYAGIDPETARDIEWLDYGVAVCGCVAQGGCRIVAENIPATPDVRTELVKSFGVKAYACHPLMQQNMVIGTLSFGTRTRINFSDDDLAMMKAVADQVAIAISRVRSEEKLRKITERFEMAQQAAEVGTWDWNIVTGRIEWSNQMFNLLGLNPLENAASFETWKTIMHPQDTEIASLRIEEAMRHKTILNSDYRIVLPDGRIRWINAVGEGKFDDQGKPLRMIGICMDITERKEAMESLSRSQKTFFELIERSPFGTYVVDSRFRIAQMNTSSQNGAFRNVLPVIGRDFAEAMHILWHEPVASDIIAAFRHTLETGESYYSPRFTNPRHDVTIVESYEWELHRMMLPDGQYGVICYYFDSTKLREAEVALRESEERYRELVDSSPEAVIVHRDGQFLYANPAALRLYGAESFDQLRQKTILDLIPDNERAIIAERMKQGAAGKRLPLRETKLMRLDGRVTLVESVGGLVTYDGKPAMQIIIRDVTERKSAQYALQAMLQRLHALVANIQSCVLFVGPNGVELANQAFCDYFNLRETPEELIGLAPQKMIEKIKDSYLHPEEEVIRIQEIIDQEEAVMGEEITMQGDRTCLRDYVPIRIDGKSYGRLWNHTDITNRKRAEEALSENERFLRETQNIARLGGWKANPESNSLMWTEGVYRIVEAPLDYNPDLIEGLKFYIPKYRPILFERLLHTLATNEPFAEECEIITMSGRHVWVEVRGLSSEREGAATYVIGIIQDISERKIKENEREKYNRALQALSRSSHAMMRATEECAYMEEICKIVVENCGYTMVWIGFAEDDEDKTVRPVAYSGFEEGYIETLKITWADTERGRGPTGTSIRTGKPATCRNMLTDPRFEPWRKEAIKRGYASSIVLPLMAGGKAIGALTIYSKEPDSFAGDEEKLLAELANDLSYGITAIRLREALRESEERFRAIAAYTPDHILMQDNDLRYRLVINPQIGLTETDMLGKTDSDILELRDADKLTAIKRKVLETGDPVSLESSLRNSDGNLEFFEGSYVPRIGRDGQVDGVIGYFRNTTERKKIEAAILQAKDEWERTFDTVPDLIAILDKEHRVIRVNKAMAARLKLTPDQCIGVRCYEAVHGLSCPPQFCPHALTCRDGGEHVAEVHEAVLGGDFLVSTTPLCDSEGKLVGSVHVARDITRRKAAEDQLAKQSAQLQERKAQLELINSELESFSYSISHDLRAPLRAIDGYSRIILRDQADKFDEKTSRQFNVIRENVRLMGVLIENILSFSRVQKTGMTISVIDMNKLAKEVWNEIQKTNEERKLNFKIKKMRSGYGDPILIRQVLVNLLANAVKFTRNKKNGVIEMSSYTDQTRIVYCIKDNGAGFDMSNYDKLFGVFQRLHSNEEYEGTGIGLAIVQRIINRHGGRVWAEGEAEKGATFYFTLSSPSPDNDSQSDIV